MEITDYLQEKIVYDEQGQYLWIVDKKGGHQKLADLRGWGAIQNLFKNKDGTTNFDAAAEFQDKLGKWVAEAINSKIPKKVAKPTLIHTPTLIAWLKNKEKENPNISIDELMTEFDKSF